MGWGWHPQISTTAVIKCIQWRLQCLIMRHDLPYERSALLKAYKIVRSYPIKGFQHPSRSVPSKRTLTYNEVSTLLKDLQQLVKTTLLRYLTNSPIRMSKQWSYG